jgi:hypothetical protein
VEESRSIANRFFPKEVVMAIVNASEGRSYEFPQPWVVIVFLLGLSALCLIAAVAPGHASDAAPYTPPAHIDAAASSEAQDNSRECDRDRNVGSQCIFE